MAFSLPGYADPETGVSLTYFVINAVNLDLKNTQMTVFVSAYPDQEAFANNNIPFSNNPFVINGATYAAFLSVQTTIDYPIGSTHAQLLQDCIAAMSQNMLTLPFFSGATIVS